MNYLEENELPRLQAKYPEMFEAEQLRCLCGRTQNDWVPWVSDKWIGIETKTNRVCGLGKISSSIPRHSLKLVEEAGE